MFLGRHLNNLIWTHIEIETCRLNNLTSNVDQVPLGKALTKVRLVKAMVFPVVMYGCESWTVKKAEHRRIDAFEVVLEKTPESPLNCKEIQPVHSKGDQSWVFFGGNDAEAETPVLWLPHAKNWLIGKDSDAGRDWGQEEKGMTEDEMAGWHHWLDGRESEWAPGVDDGQGGLACCDSWGRKELDMTERLYWTDADIKRKRTFREVQIKEVQSDTIALQVTYRKIQKY